VEALVTEIGGHGCARGGRGSQRCSCGVCCCEASQVRQNKLLVM
jgi:hypothetical protein